MQERLLCMGVWCVPEGISKVLMLGDHQKDAVVVRRMTCCMRR